MNGYASRKFLITSAVIIVTAILAYFEHMNGNTGLVLAAAISSYNWANAKGKVNDR